MRRDFVHLDVFADRAFHGNQLAVFTDATGLDAGRMQRMANEMAFAESTFVFRSDSPDADARVRIFTPGRELRWPVTRRSAPPSRSPPPASSSAARRR